MRGGYVRRIAALGLVLVGLPTLVSAAVNQRLVDAARNGDISQLTSLLKQGADANSTDSDGVTALMWASEQGHLSVVKELLAHGAQPNLKEPSGRMTALMVASAEGHEAVVKELLSGGADPNAEDSRGATAILGAAEYGYTNIVELLLDRGANANAADSRGFTALETAAAKGYTSMVRALLSRGAKVNAQDTKYGGTALIAAAGNGHAEIVKLLLEHGADPDLKLTTGQTALAFAESKGQRETAELLRKAAQGAGQARLSVPPPASPTAEATALALRLKSGDVTALSEIVLSARPLNRPISWDFNLPLESSTTKTFVAYSLKAAEAAGHGAEGRNLGGIARPWALIVDRQSGDLVLVGERGAKGELTLDDLVVALRGRFRHPDEDPGVAIGPADAAYRDTYQVRFFGGIENTRFGQVCLDAYQLLERMALGLERPGIPELKSYADLVAEWGRDQRSPRAVVRPRFWFYPALNRVNVVADVVLLEQFQMGVFTEVMYAEMDGKPVPDPSQFSWPPAEGFARAVSEKYTALAEAHGELATLEGICRLSALAAGLARAEAKPDIAYWLERYQPTVFETPRRVPALHAAREVAGGKVEIQLALDEGKGAGGPSIMTGSAGASTARKASHRPRIAVLAFHTTGPGQEHLGYVLPMLIRENLHEVQGAIVVDHGQLGRVMGDRKWEPTGADDAKGIQDLLQFTHADVLVGGTIRRSDGQWEAEVILHPGDSVSASPQRFSLSGGDPWGMGYQATLRLLSAIGVDPTNQETGKISSRPRRSPEALEELAKGYMVLEQGRAHQGIGQCKKAIELDPDFALAHAVLGGLYLTLNETDMAVGSFKEALRLDPTHLCRSNLAVAYRRKGNVDQAIQEYLQAVEHHPTDAAIRVQFAVAHSYNKDNTRAIAEFKEALRLDPYVPDAHYLLGMVYRQMERFDDAIAEFREAIRDYPADGQAYVMLAVVYQLRGEIDQSISVLQEGIKANPRYGKLHNNIAAIYVAKGMYDLAWEHVHEAQRLGFEVHPAILSQLRAKSTEPEQRR